MSEPKWTLQDAKNKFSAVVDAAVKGTPQHVSRRGLPAVVVISAEEFERLRNRRAKKASRDFIEHLLAMPKGDIEFERAEIVPRDVEF
jgi:antitoxin Phd